TVRWRQLRGRMRVELMGAPALARNHAPNRFGEDAAREVVDGASARRQVVERQVDAAAREIVLHVTNDVRQLQRKAEIECVFARFVGSASEYLDANQSHGRRNPAAVLGQLAERLVSR